MKLSGLHEKAMRRAKKLNIGYDNAYDHVFAKAPRKRFERSAVDPIRRQFVPPDPYIGVGPINQRKPRPDCGPGARRWAHIPDLDGEQIELLASLTFDSHDTTGSGAQRVAAITQDYGRRRDKSGLPDLTLKIAKVRLDRLAPGSRFLR